MKNYYNILGVEYSATEVEIKKAYKEAAKQYHPDKHQVNKEYYNQLFSEVNEAYSTLSDSSARADYDILFNYYYKTEATGFSINEEIFRDQSKYETVVIRTSIPFLNKKIKFSSEELVYNKSTIKLKDIGRIRVGLDSHGFIGTSYMFWIVLESWDGSKRINIDLNHALVPLENICESFNQILDYLYQYVAPKIVSSLIIKLDNGELISINSDLRISRVGVTIKDEDFISWENLEIADGEWGHWGYKTFAFVISDKTNPKVKLKVRTVRYWNALLIPMITNFYQTKVITSNLLKDNWEFQSQS